MHTWEAWQSLLIYFSWKRNKTPETSMWLGSSASYLYMTYIKIFLFQLDAHYSTVKFRAFHCTHHLKWCAPMRYHMEHNNLIHAEHFNGNSKPFPAGWYFFPYGLRIKLMLQKQEKPLLVSSYSQVHSFRQARVTKSNHNAKNHSAWRRWN